MFKFNNFILIVIFFINILFFINIELMGYFYIILFIFLLNIFIKKFINLYCLNKINILEKVIYFNSLLMLKCIKQKKIEKIIVFKKHYTLNKYNV